MLGGVSRGLLSLVGLDLGQPGCVHLRRRCCGAQGTEGEPVFHRLEPGTDGMSPSHERNSSFESSRFTRKNRIERLQKVSLPI